MGCPRAYRGWRRVALPPARRQETISGSWRSPDREAFYLTPARRQPCRVLRRSASPWPRIREWKSLHRANGPRRMTAFAKYRGGRILPNQMSPPRRDTQRGKTQTMTTRRRPQEHARSSRERKSCTLLEETAGHDIKPIQYGVPVNSEDTRKQAKLGERGGPLEGVRRDFGGTRRPVRWREGHAPEIRRGLDEFEAHLNFSIGRGIRACDAAKLLLVGLRILQDNDLPDGHFQGQVDQAPVRVYNRRVRHFGEGLLIGTLANHLDGNAQEHALAAATIAHRSKIGRKRRHNPRRVCSFMRCGDARVNWRKVQDGPSEIRMVPESEAGDSGSEALHG